MENDQIDQLLHKLIQREIPPYQIDESLYALQKLDYKYYLVPLVYLYTRFWWQPLEIILLRQCQDIANFALIKWTFEAYTSKMRKGNPIPEKVVQFDQKLEEAMVNVESFNLDAFAEKEHRSNYVNSIQRFINCLTQISINLKGIPHHDRQLYLRKNMIKANRALESFRRNNMHVKYCQGIIIPFKGESQLVVRVIDTEIQAFKTKKRVPYKITVETIDLEEQAPICFSKQMSIDSQAFFDYDIAHQYDYTILENFLLERKDKLVRQQLINQNKKRFNQQFKQIKLERRNSCISKWSNYSNKELLEIQLQEFFMNKKKSSHRQLDQPDFFKYLIQRYPQKQHIIMKMQNSIKEQSQIKSLKQQSLDEDGQKGPFCESWIEKEIMIKKSSPFSQYKSYKLRQLLIKGSDDLRQEWLMMQLLKIVSEQIYLKTYEIMVTSEDSGIIEFCNDTHSLDYLKKQMPNKNLKEIYEIIFQDKFEEARQNFIISLVGASLVQWFFQIKDRHNGNILLDNQGHLIHIDFGFILSLTPGGMGFESAPFKLTKEYCQLMDGKQSDMFNYFRALMYQGFLKVRQLLDKFLMTINIFRVESELPCFEKFDEKQFIDRFHINANEQEIEKIVNKLIDQSAENKRTVIYDNFQKITNGIQQ